jgi:uncharacterized protein YbjT (DUF2867 family)
MEADRRTAIATLLREAEGAHAIYEADALKGVYDEAWPRWYATYAVEQGLGEIIGRDVGVDELTTFLTESYAEFAAADPKPAEPWADHTATRIVAEL